MKRDYNKNKIAREVHLRIIYSLRQMLGNNKIKRSEDPDSSYKFPSTYRDIYFKSDIREATISDTFNGKTLPNATTLFIIIESMGYSLKEFTEIYEQVSKEELRLLDVDIDVREYFR